MKITSVLIILLSVCCNLHAQQKTVVVYTQATIDSSLTLKPQWTKKLKTNDKIIRYTDSVNNLYYTQGYLQTHYKLTEPSADTLQQLITLGEKVKYVRLIKEQDDALNDIVWSTLSRKRDTITIPFTDTEETLNMLHGHLLNEGYLFNTLQLSKFKQIHLDTIEATLMTVLTEKRKLNRVITKGYPEFKKPLLTKNELSKKELNNKLLNSIQKRYNQLPYIEEIKPPELLFKKDSTLLYIYIKKKNANYVDGFLGLNNVNDKTILTGNIEARLVNNLNKGESLHFRYITAANDQRSLLSTVTYPQLLKSKIGLTGTLQIVRRDTIFQNALFKTGLIYTSNDNNNLAIQYIHKNATSTEVNITSEIKSAGVEISYKYTLQNKSLLLPEKDLLEFRTSLLQREGADITTGTQTNIALRGHKQLNIIEKLHLYVNATYERINAQNSLLSEIMQIGGKDTVRGFIPLSIDTDEYLSAQFEIRYVTGRNFYVYSISDYGRYTTFLTKRSQNLYGLGMGLAILTKSGLLKINISNGSNDLSNLRINRLIAEINLGITF